LLVFPYFFECFLVRFLECSIPASLISYEVVYACPTIYQLLYRNPRNRHFW
jgi:hypothetical protein